MISQTLPPLASAEQSSAFYYFIDCAPAYYIEEIVLFSYFFSYTCNIYIYINYSFI